MELSHKIGVVGLGYVGLPLAIAFSKKFNVIGFDISEQRITELNTGIDSTQETNPDDLKDNNNIEFTSNYESLGECNFIIVTVPTPVTSEKIPDLTYLIEASNMIGKIMKHGSTIIYESTVYPGVTEDVCVPILSKKSNLKFNEDFFVGYSPERINPGDNTHKINDVIKVTSGSNKKTANVVDQLYSSIIEAGTHLASSIKVAEAAKVIENTQRDVNIALVNELSKIFNIMEIDTEEVLKAASTKWNFTTFWPGLVGGHCIGVDPYYLTYRSEDLGYSPEIILAGRKLNDGMGKYVAHQLIEAMNNESISSESASILVMGLTFKENCPDIRNTKVIDLILALQQNGCSVDTFDPWVSSHTAQETFGTNHLSKINKNSYDAIVLAVSHDDFKKLGSEKIRKFGRDKHILYDLKYLFPKEETDLRL